MEPNNQNQVPQASPSSTAPPTQNLSQVTQSTSESGNPKRRIPVLKLVVAGIVVILIVLVIAFIGFLLVGQNTSNENQKEKSATNNDNSASDSNSDWLTFDSSIEDFLITFKYPKDWDMSNVSTVVSLYPPLGGKDEAEERIKQLESANIQIVKQDYDPEDCEEEYCPNFESKTDKVINGKNFRELKGTDTNIDDFTYEFIDNVVKIGDWYYVVSAYADNIEGGDPGKIPENVLNVYNQLLSTVKFKESNLLSVDSFNWKKYTNENFGVSVNYPDVWILDEDHQNIGDKNSFIVFSIRELPSGGAGVTFHKNYKEIETYGICFRQEMTTESVTVNNREVEKVFCNGLPSAIRYNDGSDEYTLRGYAVNKDNVAVIEEILNSFQFTN